MYVCMYIYIYIHTHVYTTCYSPSAEPRALAIVDLEAPVGPPRLRQRLQVY